MKRHLTRWTTLLMTLLLVSGCGYDALQVKEEAVFKAWGDIDAQATVFAAFEDEEIAEDFAPTVVAETTQKIRTMSVGTAVSELDFTGAPVVMFRNAGNGGVNVVYAKRGWEVACGAYERWFDRFSGARVIAASTPEELLDAVGREML